MSPNQLAKPSITHIGLIVRDIVATRQRYIDMLGAPEAAIGEVDAPEIAKTVLRGQKVVAKAKLCHLRVGPILVELIQPMGGPSTWQEFLDTKGEGVHHIAFDTPDAKADMKVLEAAGATQIQYGEWVGGNYTYADTTPQLGVMVELIKID